MGVLGDPIRSRAENPVPDEVPAVTENDQVVAALLREARDELCRVTGADVDVDLDTGLLALRAGGSGERPEEAVLLASDLIDLADGRRIRGERAFDRESGEPRPSEHGKLDRLGEGVVGAFGLPSIATRIFSNGI